MVKSLYELSFFCIFYKGKRGDWESGDLAPQGLELGVQGLLRPFSFIKYKVFSYVTGYE